MIRAGAPDNGVQHTGVLVASGVAALEGTRARRGAPFRGKESRHDGDDDVWYRVAGALKC